MDARSKQVESLKSLSEKLWNYSSEFINLIMRATFYHHGTTQPNPMTIEYEKLGEKLIDFWAFFIQSRSFLSDEIAEKIHSIYKWVSFFMKQRMIICQMPK
jgi:hypothetical protein